MSKILVDYRNREIELGQKVRIEEDIPSVDGMLHKDTIVKVDEVKNDMIRVTDGLGKIWWINPSTVSASFL